MKEDVNMRFIGSKINLLEDIRSFIEENISKEQETFLDLFGGTNAVGNFFKSKYTVYSNDILYFSYVNGKARIENNNQMNFQLLQKEGIDDPFSYLNEIRLIPGLATEEPGYYEQAYTPTGGSKYLTVENGKRVDLIRRTIDEWEKKELVTEYEYYYLLSSLIESISLVSNTTGTYGAFLKKWDARALKQLIIEPLDIIDNGRNNKAFNEDANKLVKNISADIAYIDTPYNNRQYASNYHLLENVARNNMPDLKGVTKLFDWSDLRSNYAMKSKAFSVMADLLENIDSTHIILSYNNEGIIPEDELLTLLKKNSLDNNVVVKRIPYRKYKSKIPSRSDDLYEILAYIQKKPEKKRSIQIKKEVKHKKIERKYIKSPLNYIGGKYKLLDQIIPLFPKKINTFVDLFSGGANVGINVEAKEHIFNDMNYRINEMFRYFHKQNPNTIVNLVNETIEKYGLSKTNDAAYLKLREDYNNDPTPLHLYVLVCYSYNYQFRFNNSMQFNNPFGRNRSHFSEGMEKNLKAFVKRIKKLNVSFQDNLFDEFDISKLGEGDFVYLDPPYLITTGSYNDGNRGFVNWSEEQEKKLYDLMNNLTHKGVRYALSNVIEHKGKSNEHLKHFLNVSNTYVHPITASYNNSSYNVKKTGVSREVLVTNYNPETYELIGEDILKEE